MGTVFLEAVRVPDKDKVGVSTKAMKYLIESIVLLIQHTIVGVKNLHCSCSI